MARGGIDTFGRTEFEAALPTHKTTGAPLWRYVGVIQGEHCYRVDPFPDHPLAILVRSSIKADGVSAGLAEDSIRPLCVTRAELDKGTVNYHGGKLGKYITRRAGWGERMGEQLRRFAVLLLWCRRCKCGAVYAPFTTRKADSPNKGRDFVKCVGCNSGFTWVEGEDGTPLYPPDGWQDQLTRPAAQPTTREENPVKCVRCGVRAVMPSKQGAGFHCFRRLGGCGGVFTESQMKTPPGRLDLDAEAEVMRGEMENAHGSPSMHGLAVAVANIMHPQTRRPSTPTGPTTAPNPTPPAVVLLDGFTVDLSTLRNRLLEIGGRLEQIDGDIATEILGLIR